MEYAIWTFEQLRALFDETCILEIEDNYVVAVHGFHERIKYIESDLGRSNNTALYAVAYEGKKLVGIRKFGNSPCWGQWTSAFISVDPDYWRRGIATQLNHVTGKFLQEHGIKSLMLFHESEMGAMIGMQSKTEKVLVQYDVSIVRE